MADAHHDFIIRHGTVITETETLQTDVAIAGEKIVALGHNLAGANTIDATGLLVLPGGIDPHVHLQYPQGPQRIVSSDDWLTGTVAAACGGTTTIIDFVEAHTGESFQHAFEARRAEAAAAVIDYGLHLALNRADADSLAEIPALIAAGITSFKIYMAYGGLRLTNGEMLASLQALATYGGLALVHAENHDVITYLTAQQLAAGHTEPCWHPRTRPALGEAEATFRALALAEITNVPMHIVHVSAARTLDVLRQFSQTNPRLTGEVCTQHLLLTDALYEQLGFEPAKYVMSPPLRARADTDAMWQGLQSGALSFVVTDHCPFTLAQKRGARRTPEFRRVGDELIANPPEVPWADGLPPFNQIPGGAPGIETRLPGIYHHGVNAGRLSLNQFVQVTSTAAAKRFGLYPRKGILAPGADADIVLFDPNHEWTIRARDLHQNCDYTPYEGFKVTGAPRLVFSRGKMIVRDGKFVGTRGAGNYLPRMTSS